MKFLRISAYTKLDKMRNTDILEELKMNSVLENI